MISELNSEIGVLSKKINDVRQQSEQINKLSNKITSKVKDKNKITSKIDNFSEKELEESTTKVRAKINEEISDNIEENKELIDIHHHLIAIQTDLGKIKDSELKLDNITKSIAHILKIENEHFNEINTGVAGLFLSKKDDSVAPWGRYLL